MGNLLLDDAKKFIDKYTRFMTKDIYISKHMDDDFLKKYVYLKEDLEKNKYLYQDHKDYKNLFRIFEHHHELLKLHNKKYLKKAILKEEDFFDDLYDDDILDKNKKMIILSSEDDMVVISRKNYIPLIIGKIKYLRDVLHKDLKSMEIMVDDREDFLAIKKEASIYDLEDVSLYLVSEYGLSTLGLDESILDRDKLYEYIFQYIIHTIYPNKEYFTKFYQAFSDSIYLNRDYKDFDTFHDYHCYLYKRKFLESKLTIKKFIERETKKRKGQLRTIHQVFVSCAEEVDVGNFLYLNSIDFKYDKDNHCFLIDTVRFHHIISFEKVKKYDEYEKIILDKDGQYLETLVYELVKRQYGMERRSDEEVYAMFLDTTMDSYFSDFIYHVVLPSIDYYQEYQSFDDTNFSSVQKEELLKFYQLYMDFMKKEKYVDDFQIHKRVQNLIDHSSYEYHFVLDHSSFHYPHQSFLVLKSYPLNDILKDNVRLIYDYKAYLNEKKCLPIIHVFYGWDELSYLTQDFMKMNLEYLNSKMKDNKREVCFCVYEDDNKLKASSSMNSLVSSIVSLENKNVSFAFRSKNEFKELLYGGYFSKKSVSVLEDEHGEYECFVLSHITKKSDVIVLPTLISHNRYFEDKDEVYCVKVGLYMALNKCRNGIYLLCPRSKWDKYRKIFQGMAYFKFLD